MKGKQKRTFLSKKQNENLIKEIIAGNYDRGELCKKYNISKSTFFSRQKEIREGKFNIKEKSTKEAEELTTIDKESSELKLIPYYRNRSINVGLIKDRHNIPCNEFIFNIITDEEMFDYNYLDSIISKFILDRVGIRVKNNINYAEHDLHVYVTGLQCALASLIKMCTIYNVSLTLLHWNRDTNKYEPQIIFKDKFESSKDYFLNITGDIYFTDNCPDIKTVKNSKYIFVLKEIRSKIINDNLSPISNNTFLYKDEDLVWEEYLKLCKNSCRDNDEISIHLESGRIVDDNYEKIRIMSRTYNFDTQKQKNKNNTTLRNVGIHKILVQKEDLYV